MKVTTNFLNQVNERFEVKDGNVYWTESVENASQARGRKAGILNGTRPYILNKTFKFPADILAWVIHHNEYPVSRIEFRNGDVEDLSKENRYVILEEIDSLDDFNNHTKTKVIRNK